MKTCTCVAGSLLALLLAPAVAGAAPGYAAEKIALDGETAPDSGGAAWSSLDLFAVDLNAGGDVAFGGMLTGATPAWGVFVHSGGVNEARAITGDAAPAPLGGTYLAFGFPNLDDAGDITFGALVKPTPTTSATALVRAGAGGDTLLVSSSDAAPGAGGTLELAVGDTSFHARGPGGAPVFRSDVIGGAAGAGVFVGTSSAVALAGDASPAGGTFLYLDTPGANGAGKVVFGASLDAAPVDSGLFVHDGGGAATLVLSGDVGPNGETYLNFYLPQVSASGDVLFLADWAPDGTSAGVYLHTAGGTETVVRSGQVLPGTGGATIDSLGGPAFMADDGSVAFSASLVGGSTAAGVFATDANGALRLVARSGDPVPGAPGQTFASFGVAMANAAGQVAFAGVTDTGAHGVFLATREVAAIPALPPIALAVLSTLLVLFAALPRGCQR